MRLHYVLGVNLALQPDPRCQVKGEVASSGTDVGDDAARADAQGIHDLGRPLPGVALLPLWISRASVTRKLGGGLGTAGNRRQGDEKGCPSRRSQHRFGNQGGMLCGKWKTSLGSQSRLTWRSWSKLSPWY